MVTCNESRVDLPAQAKCLKCARTATGAFPSTTTPRRRNQAGSYFGLGLQGCLSGSRCWPPLADAENILPSDKNPLQCRDKPYFIKTSSFYAGTSEKVRLRGQIRVSRALGFGFLDGPSALPAPVFLYTTHGVILEGSARRGIRVPSGSRGSKSS